MGTTNSLDVKTSAVVALGDIGTGHAGRLQGLLGDAAPILRASAAAALGKIATTKALSDNVIDQVAKGLTDESPLVKAASAQALGSMGEDGAVFSDEILDLFQDQSKVVRAAAVKAMGGLGTKGQLYAIY